MPAETAATDAVASFSSIDGTTRVSGFLAEPDRYRHLFDQRRHGPVIPRGSGLSYVAASMGEGVVSIGLRHFDRILAFDAATGVIEVEAGATLGTVLGFLLSQGFILPVMPGHPAISVGGCIACDVHGKNPARDGTFRAHLLSLDLWHPRLGLRRMEPQTPGFEATCGGYGLTGIIVSARLQARKVSGRMARLSLAPVADLDAAQALLRQKVDSSDLLYSWHDWTRPGMPAGYVVEGTIVAGGEMPRQDQPPPDLKSGGRYPLMNRFTIPLFNALYGRKLAASNGRLSPLSQVLFPISSLGFYFRLFGNGFLEHQILVSHDSWPRYWPAFGRLLQEHGVRPVVTTLKLFAGQRTGIAFSGDGVSLTINVVNDERSRILFAALDTIDCDFGAITNPAKDSRLGAETFRRQTPGYEEFLARRGALDPGGTFRSSLSTRLAL